MKRQAFTWLLRIIVAVILLQTLFFKFTASDESVYIFTKLGMEPWGRIGSGIAELVAAILILAPRTTFYGAVMVLGILGGAIVSHLTVLGIEVKNDGGLLFGLATVGFVCSAILAYKKRSELRILKI